MKIFSYLLSAACMASVCASYSPHCSAQMRLWGTYYGGMEGQFDEESSKVAVDPRGNVYVAGLTGSMSDIATPNGFDSILEKPSNQGFLAKFDPNGGLVWATYYGDGVSTKVSDVGTDGNGNVYIVGEVQCPSHELSTLSAHDKFCNASDMFLAKFSPSGKRLWATYYGGDNNELAGGISVMPSGDMYLIGTTSSTGDQIISNSSQDSTLDGGQDALVAKFNSQGQLLWSRYYGGNGHEFGYDIACKKWGYTFQERCYITGSTSSKQGIATLGAYDTNVSLEDAFVAQIDGSNGKILWSTYYGGNDTDIGKSVAVDKNLNVYVGGDTRSKDSIASMNAHDVTLGGGNDVFAVYDMFLVKFDIFGQRQAGTYYGTSDMDYLADVDVDGNGDVYLLGHVNGAGDFASPNAYDMTFGGSGDAVIAKFDTTLKRVWGTYYGGDHAELWYGIGGIKVDKDNRVYVTGATRSSDSISTFGTHQPVKKELEDVFLVKFAQ